MKDFLKWSEQKSKIDSGNYKAPYVSEGDIWWASTGINIGSEMNGKSDIFSRPVIILKKLSHNFYFVVPTTTKEKEGTWYVSYYQNGMKMSACLHQARAIDYRRILGKLGTLDDSDFKLVKLGFQNLYR